MQYTEGTIGRVFILRLDDGEVLNDTIEAFARDHDVHQALVTYLGGSADGSKVVVGPELTDASAAAAGPDAASGETPDSAAASSHAAGPDAGNRGPPADAASLTPPNPWCRSCTGCLVTGRSWHWALLRRTRRASRPSTCTPPPAAKAMPLWAAPARA